MPQTRPLPREVNLPQKGSLPFFLSSFPPFFLSFSSPTFSFTLSFLYCTKGKAKRRIKFLTIRGKTTARTSLSLSASTPAGGKRGGTCAYGRWHRRSARKTGLPDPTSIIMTSVCACVCVFVCVCLCVCVCVCVCV